MAKIKGYINREKDCGCIEYLFLNWICVHCRNAIDRNDLWKTRLIAERNLKKINSNEKDENGRLLLYACGYGDGDHIFIDRCIRTSERYDLMKILLECGADVNRSMCENETALMIICRAFNCIMDKRCVGRKIENPEGMREKIIRIIELLINYGAKLNLQNSDGDSILHILLEYNENYILTQSLIKVIKMLKEKGLNVNLKNANGLTAIEEFMKKINNYGRLISENDKSLVSEIIKICTN